MVRTLAKRVLSHAPGLLRIAASSTNPVNRANPLRAAARAAAFEVRTVIMKRPTKARVGTRSWVVIYPGETNSPNAAYRNPPIPEMLVWNEILDPGDLFIDVGANVGLYTIFALDRGAQVMAVEADAVSAGRIREHLALNGYVASVVEKALSSEPGIAYFTVGLDSFNHLTTQESVGVPVEVTTLDVLLGDRVAAGVKVDVQGVERLVVQGATKALGEERIRVLQLEWNHWSQEALGETRSPVAEILRSYGYTLWRPNSGGVLQPAGDEPGFGGDVFAIAPSCSAQYEARGGT